MISDRILFLIIVGGMSSCSLVGYLAGKALTKCNADAACPTFEEKLLEHDEDLKHFQYISREYKEAYHECQLDVNQYVEQSLDAACLEEITEAHNEIDKADEAYYQCEDELEKFRSERRRVEEMAEVLKIKNWTD